MSIPIRMSQAGSIRLTQIAAYDKHGEVMPVKFHVSVYTNNGMAVELDAGLPGAGSWPVADPNPDFPPYLNARKVRRRHHPDHLRERDRRNDRPGAPVLPREAGRQCSRTAPTSPGVA